MFAGLANFIARRHKLIIIAWIVALLVALPLAPLASSVVQYEETEMAPDDLESSVANSFISASFGSISEQPSTLIVLRSGNVMDEESRRTARGIESKIGTASLFGDIDKVEVTSPYTVAEDYTLNVIKGLNLAYSAANQTAYVIFGAPQEFRGIFVQTNITASTLYGVPTGHTLVWTETAAANPELSVQQVDNSTYQAFRSQLEVQILNMEPSWQAFVLGWYRAYVTAWNGTEGLAAQASQRASAAHIAAFPAFLSEVSASDQERSFISQVNDAFAASTIEFTNVSGFARLVLDRNLGSMTAVMPPQQASQVEGYMDATVEWWTSLGAEPSDQVFDTGVMAVSQTFGESIPVLEARKMFLGIRSAIGGLAYYDDLVLRTTILSEMIVSSPVMTQITSRPWVVAAAGAIGEFDIMKAQVLSQTIVDNSSLADFPIVLPHDLMGQLISPDNTTMLMALTYAPAEEVANPGQANVGTVRGIVASEVSGTSVKAYVTGTDALNTDIESSTFDDLRIIEPITIILVLVLIGLFFRSFVASSIPPMAIGIAVGISYALVYLVGSYVMSIHYAVLTLLLTSMMGAGCDYCIFILSRYREERQRGRDKNESVKQAITWAGESIATSGVTVIIGFGALSIAQFSLMQSMGVIIALGIAVALLISLTLLPAVLFLLGDKIFWPAKLDRQAKVPRRPGYFARSARFSLKYAKAILIGAVLITVPTTYFAATMDTSYNFIGAMAETESKQGLSALQDGFGGGKITPTQMVVTMGSSVVVDGVFDSGALAEIEDLASMVADLDNVKQVTGPTRPYGTTIDHANTTVMESYRPVIAPMVSGDQRSVLLTITFEDEPFAMRSINTIQELRDIAAQSQGKEGIDGVLVGGATASMFDISAMTQDDFRTMVLVVIVGIYIVLMVVLGSLINPLRSILTILLSISWTLAVTLLLFQEVLGQPVLYLVPLILFLVCMGLGMDYDILLTTRIREEVAKGRDTNDAIVYAVEQTGGIITACGIIMAAAFGSMMLSSGFLLKQFGFALMFAILLDATVVRIYLVPAIMSLLGKWNWWAPGPLKRMNDRRNHQRVEALMDTENPALVKVETP